jgi:hypothetical protein
MQTKFVVPLTMAAALALAGCGSTKIGRINADPTRFQNKTVRVEGRVVNSMGVLGAGGYQVEDDTGKIYVLSATGVPSRGSRVEVTGRVQPGATILGRSFGTTIKERQHKVRD